MIVAIDSGRDGIKSATWKGKSVTSGYFRNKIGNIDFKTTRNKAFLVDKDNDLICSINKGRPIAYGDVCEKIFPEDEIHFVTEDITYLDYAINYAVVSIAKFMGEDDNDKEIVMGFTLTSKNENYRDKIDEQLKKSWTVDFYDLSGKIIKTRKFSIKTVAYFHQGWLAYMNFAIMDDYSINKEWAGKSVFGFDMGRKTMNVHYIKQLGSVKDKSYDDGMELYFKYIKEQLYRQHDIDKETFEVERIIKNGETINKGGFEINTSHLQKEAMIKMMEKLKNHINEDFSKYVPQETFFTGGGALTFGNVLKQMFPSIHISENPIFDNVNGLLKILVRKFYYKKTGV